MKIDCGEEMYDVTFKKDFLLRRRFKKIMKYYCWVTKILNDSNLKGKNKYEKIDDAYGEARHNPIDPTDKKIGRKIAFTRAIKCFPREKRKIFWEEYKKCCNLI